MFIRRCKLELHGFLQMLGWRFAMLARVVVTEVINGRDGLAWLGVNRLFYYLTWIGRLVS